MRHSLRNSGQDPRYAAFRAKGGTLSYETWAKMMNIAVSIMASAPAAKEKDEAQSRKSGKTYADLIAELRWLGPATVMNLVFNGDTRQCTEISDNVTQYFLERGFVATSARGAGKYRSHFDLAVFTADHRWVSVDPTAIQFHAPNTEGKALRIAADRLDVDTRGMSEEQKLSLLAPVFEPTVQWSVEGMLDGVRAFEIAEAPHISIDQKSTEYSPPNPKFCYDKSWRKHWQFFRKMAEELARGDFSEIDDIRRWKNGHRPYWMTELSRRLKGKKLSGI